MKNDGRAHAAVEECVEKAKALGAICNSLVAERTVPIPVRRALVTACILNSLLWGMEVAPVCAADTRRLEVLWNRAVRLVCGTNLQ